MRMVMVMVMMIASCTIDFFIKMTICHFPQFLCSMSVPPHSLVHTAHSVLKLAGRRVYSASRVYCREYRRGVLVTKHSLLAPASTSLPSRWGRTHEKIIGSYVWGAHIWVEHISPTLAHPHVPQTFVFRTSIYGPTPCVRQDVNLSSIFKRNVKYCF